MFRHDDIAGNIASVPLSNSFQFTFEDLAGRGRAEQFHAAITARAVAQLL